MKIRPWFTHLQAILGVYDFLLSDKYNWSYLKNCPCSYKLYNVAQLVEHGASNAKIMGSIPRESKTW